MEALVAVALAPYGYVSEVCLRMLTRWAQDRGLEWVMEQVEDDPGLCWIPTADMAYGLPRFLYQLTTHPEMV